MPENGHFDKRELLLWTEALEAYARDWDDTFEHKASYFTQEFWYLLVNCVVNHWNGTPLSVTGACQQMKSGSNRTREDRVRKAVADGYLQKRQRQSDRRGGRCYPERETGTADDRSFHSDTSHYSGQARGDPVELKRISAEIPEEFAVILGIDPTRQCPEHDTRRLIKHVGTRYVIPDSLRQQARSRFPRGLCP